MGEGKLIFNSVPRLIVSRQVKLREGAMILMMGTKDEDMPIQPVEKTKYSYL